MEKVDLVNVLAELDEDFVPYKKETASILMGVEAVYKI
jgi:hypothetical protein